MNIADVILLVFIGFGLIIGLVRKWWRLIIGLVVFGVLICGFLYLGPADYISNFVRFDLINWLVDNKIIPPIEINLQEQLGVTFKIETVQEAFLLLQNFDLDPQNLISMSDIFCKMASVIVILPIGILVSWLVSTLLYWVLLRWIMPKFLRKGIINILIGGVVGAIGYGIIGMIVICVIYSPVYGISNNIITPLLDSNSELSVAITNFVGTSSFDQIQQVLKTVNGYIGNFNPLADSSILCRPMINLFGSIGLDPFYIISTTPKEGEDGVSFLESFNNFLKDVTNAIIEKSGSVAGA